MSARELPFEGCGSRPFFDLHGAGNVLPTIARANAAGLASFQEDELIVDNFAGGGGASEGLEQAFGRPVDIAINHDPEALAMHALNHPYTVHLCESVWTVHPLKVTHGRSVGLLWLSPDCKHFSKAKGGTPVAKHIRGLAWVGLRWVALTKPRVFILENVEEFQTWGPLLVDSEGNARPDPAKKGKTFESFVRQLRAHGYEVEWRELRACDHDTPTIRKRLFLIARRDGVPITWPEATNGDPTAPAVRAGKLAPFRTAAECIDWSIEGTSVFGRKKPLAVNTQRRVAKGLWRHVLTSASPFIVGVGGRMGQSPARSVHQPAQTLTAKADSCVAQPVLTPFLTEHANASNQRTMAADQPLRTQLAQVKGGHFSMVAPTLTPLRGTSEAHLGGQHVETPAGTVSAGGTHHGLTSAHLVTIGYGERPGQEARTQSVPQPLGTAVAGGIKQGVVVAHLVDMGHGEGPAGGKRFSHGVRSLEQPLNAITASGGTSALVAACLEQANGGFYDGDGRAADWPTSTITSSGSQQRLVAAYCVKYYSSGGQWQGLAEPMHTLPTKGRMGLVEVLQVPADCLAPEHRERARQCAELLHTHLPEHFPEPAELVLMAWDGQWWVLVDITLRMLRPPELFRAQGFPKHYVINEIPDPALLFIDGRQAADPRTLPRIPLSATAQVRMVGNSVCPPLAKALALANFPAMPVSMALAA